jgi:uncharacterized protein with FMN-binding domain
VKLMSGLSLATLAVSLRGSEAGAAHHPVAAQTVGIVQPTAAARRSTAVALPHRAAAARATRAAVTAATRAPVPTQAPAPARVAVAQRASAAPRPVATRPAPSPTPTSVTVNGAPADTQYGPVQVQVTIRGHRIVRADAIDYPQGSSRDQQINSQAIPQLDDETLQAQSAQIDTVSGATYTSEGYRQSLQSALDAAHQAGAW